MTIFIDVFSFIFGTMLGSFSNVVIYRLHAGDSPMRGRSYCPHCKHTLSASDLVPVLSFLFLRGKCRYCGKKISIQYPLVELAMGVIAMLMIARFGIGDVAAAGIVLGVFLLVIFVYDLKYQIILDRVSVPAMAVAALLSVFMHRTFFSILLGGILGMAFFLIQYLVSRGRWIGGGDIRLGAVLGLALGWPLVVVALVIAYLSGALVAAALILTRRRSWTSMLPFGTFLSVAGIISLLWGDAILNWYLHGGFLIWFANTFLSFYNPK